MTVLHTTRHEVITHFHLFCGSAGGALGFQEGEARVGHLEAEMKLLGGIDVSPAAIKDFDKLTGVKGTVMDLFDLEDYVAFHGHPPPEDWEEATPADVLRAAQGQFPDIVFLSPPCKGFSGLLNSKAAKALRYQALNRLVIRGIQLMLLAFQDDPPSLILLENVPRIQTRGRWLLDIIVGLLAAAGYSVAETTHNCGELGGLAQNRQRFLLVARHRAKCPPFLYEPPKQPVKGVGEVLSDLPMPDAPEAGPMHRLPRITWKTAVRLALIEPGKDWRHLKTLTVEEGVVKGVRLVPNRGDYHSLGVRRWDQAQSTITASMEPGSGYGSIADPRINGEWHGGVMGVKRPDEPACTVTGRSGVTTGAFSIADPRPPRIQRGGKAHNNVFRVVDWDEPSQAVTSGTGPSSGGQAVADPRCTSSHEGCGKSRVTKPTEPAGTVIGASTTGQGAFAVADPMPAAWAKGKREYVSGGHYGVVPWEGPVGTVVGNAKHDKGVFSVGDPRPLPSPRDRDFWVIVSQWGTWNRPFTTLELAVLQSLPMEMAMGEPLILDGKSHEKWRERIGNMVPRATARAIASVMAETILRARAEQSFKLSATPIWVRPIYVGLSMDRWWPQEV